jgi:hypothetical protein
LLADQQTRAKDEGIPKMTFSIVKRLAPAAACAVALMGAAALPTAANADVTWFVSGDFDDGGTLSGWFTVNVYGYLSNFDLKTTAGTAANSDGALLPGFEYTPENSYYSTGVVAPFYIDAQPQWQSDLHLNFANTLSHPSYNVINGGSQSFECNGSYSCFLTVDTKTRYLTSGFAQVPEPATWGLMILGFGAAGAMLRRARSARPAVATA